MKHKKKAYELHSFFFLFYFYSRLASSTSFSNQAERYGSKGYLGQNETINLKHHPPWPWNQLNLTFEKSILRFVSKRKSLSFLTCFKYLVCSEDEQEPIFICIELEKTQIQT